MVFGMNKHMSKVAAKQAPKVLVLSCMFACMLYVYTITSVGWVTHIYCINFVGEMQRQVATQAYGMDVGERTSKGKSKSDLGAKKSAGWFGVTDTVVNECDGMSMTWKLGLLEIEVEAYELFNAISQTLRAGKIFGALTSDLTGNDSAQKILEKLKGSGGGEMMLREAEKMQGRHYLLEFFDKCEPLTKAGVAMCRDLGAGDRGVQKFCNDFEAYTHGDTSSFARDADKISILGFFAKRNGSANICNMLVNIGEWVCVLFLLNMCCMLLHFKACMVAWENQGPRWKVLLCLIPGALLCTICITAIRIVTCLNLISRWYAVLEKVTLDMFTILYDDVSRSVCVTGDMASLAMWMNVLFVILFYDIKRPKHHHYHGMDSSGGWAEMNGGEEGDLKYRGGPRT